MFCPNCGAAAAEESKFCQDCGGSLQSGPEEVAATTQLAPEAPAQSLPMQPPVFHSQPTAQPPQQHAQVAHKNRVNSSAGNPIGIDPREKVYGVGGYLVTLLLLCIPLVNFVLLIVWAVSGTVNKNKKNMAIAMLILMAIMIVVSIVFSVTLSTMFTDIVNQYTN